MRLKTHSIAFIHGFVVLSFEILAIRLFTGYFGSGQVQTSLIIGGVLLFYALGNCYYRPETGTVCLPRNFLILAFLNGLVLTNPSLHYFHRFFLFAGIDEPLWQATLAVLLTIALPAFLFGMNYPAILAMREKNSSDRDLHVLIGVSTLGSFLGAVGTSLLLMYILSASEMIVLNTFFLGILIFISAPRISSRVLATTAVGATIAINLHINKRFVDIETGVANYNIDLRKNFKGLEINGTKWGSVLFNDNSSALYNNALHELILNSASPLKVLVLGAGAMVLSNRNRHHSYTFVDIDPKLPKVIKEFNPDAKGKLVIRDAREFLISSKEKFDVIMQDVFHGDITPPPHLLTVEHYRLVRDHLTPDGFFVTNLVHHGVMTKGSTPKLALTLTTVFGPCYFLHFGPPFYEKKNEIRQTAAFCQAPDETLSPSSDDKY